MFTDVGIVSNDVASEIKRKMQLVDIFSPVKLKDIHTIDLTEELCYYWTVTNDGKVQSFANKNTMYGTKPYFRTIECSPIDKNEFSG